MKKFLLIILLLLIPRLAIAQAMRFPTVIDLPVDCVVGDVVFKLVGGLYFCASDDTWTVAGGSESSIPSGSILLINSGSCPTGFTEDSSLNGKTLFGTLAANKDVGDTGGSDSITPTVNSLTAAAQAFTGSSADTNAVSAGTPSGTNGTGTVTATGTINTPTLSWPAGVPTFSGTPFTSVINHTHTVTSVGSSATGSTTNLTGASDTSSTTATAANPAGGVSSITPAGTVAWPVGVPTSNTLTFTGSSAVTSAQTFTGSALGTHQHTLTATGTNGTSSVTGTLDSFDNRSAYMKVIFCKAN
jgi:hypothetical protein